MEQIDAVYFINLEHRKDRLEQFCGEMNRIGMPPEKVHRIDAVLNQEIGALGCSRSHIKAIDTFLKSSAKTCCIFEDDFTFTLDINYCKFLLNHLFNANIQYDVVMLSGNVMKAENTTMPFLQKVIDAQTASGFLITRSFAHKLKQNLEEGAEQLEKWYGLHKERKHEFCLDIYWKKLQPENNWYIFKPKMGIQRESYSDNEQKVTNYGV